MILDPPLAAVMAATWPPERSERLGPWRLRVSAGGGQRVQATSVEDAWQPGDIAEAEAAMDRLHQPRIWVLGPQDAALDAALAARGYRVKDPVIAYAAPIDRLAGAVSPMAAFAHWPPLAITRDIWAEGGIGPDRCAVMDRVTTPKTAILGRTDDTPSGAAFVALAGQTAMLHALEVRPALRRQGSAHKMLTAAANWAQDQGATTFSLVVTEANTAARTLYERMGMIAVDHYHYRVI